MFLGPFIQLTQLKQSRISTSDSNVSIKQLRMESSFFSLTLTDDHNKLHGQQGVDIISPSKVHLALFWMKKNLPHVATQAFLPLMQLGHFISCHHECRQEQIQNNLTVICDGIRDTGEKCFMRDGKQGSWLVYLLASERQFVCNFISLFECVDQYQLLLSVRFL